MGGLLPVLFSLSEFYFSKNIAQDREVLHKNKREQLIICMATRNSNKFLTNILSYITIVLALAGFFK